MKSDCTRHNCVFGDRALFVEEVGHGKVGKVGENNRSATPGILN